MIQVRKVLVGILLLVLGFGALPVGLAVGGPSRFAVIGLSAGCILAGGLLLVLGIRSITRLATTAASPTGPVLPSQIAAAEPEITLPAGVPEASRAAVEQALEMMRSMGVNIDPKRFEHATFVDTGGTGGAFPMVAGGTGFAVADAALLSAGLDGTATVSSVVPAGVVVNGMAVAALTLSVQAPGRPPYAVQHQEMLPADRLATLAPGVTLLVKIDPVDPNRVAVVWPGRPSPPAGPATGGLRI
ncbi:MAG TPA: hypothetical protein VEO00_03995 [Actinomycetota bacterium]|nr:hypothetical protein [Actinomycetota bacterium]